MKKIYLIDVSSLFFRAFYAIPPLTSPNGLPVNAVYGFLSMIVKLIKEEKPEYMVFCYDRKEPSFRKEIYPEYKAHRTEMPEDLVKQMPLIKKIAELLGVPTLDIPRYEADDIIGTIATVMSKKNFESVIVSTDKDFAQLIGPHITMYDTMKNVRYNEGGVVAKWGVRPDQFIDYLAIIGDSSDNIPGVFGVGEKGAIKLIHEFGSLEEIYDNVEKFQGKSLYDKLLKSKENAFLSKKLATIVTDVPVSHDPGEYKLHSFRSNELRDFLQELNFKSLEKTLLGEIPLDSHATDAEAAKYKELSMDADQLSKWLHNKNEIWSFCDDRGVYFLNDNELVIPMGDTKTFSECFTHRSIIWNGFDLKKIWHQLDIHNSHHKFQASWDSMLAAYAIKTQDCEDFKKVYERMMGKKLPDFMTPSVYVQAQMDLAIFLKEEITKNKAEKIFNEIEIPLLPILYLMEKRGILIDIRELNKQSAELKEDIQKIEKKIHQLSGESFNVASPKQLSVILFEKLKLPVVKKNKTGYSTDNDVLVKLNHEITDLVLEFRELSKLKSTYVDALPQLINPLDGRIHTHFNQALTTTGRLSSTQPNLQNIPIRTLRGQKVRTAFVAKSGQKLLSVDYSQIELRILAHISEDPNLCKAFRDGLDVHTATAAEIFNKPLSEVTTDLRRAAKAVNFGIAYGQGVFGLSESLRISRSEAQEIIKNYFLKFKNVQDYIDQTIKKAHENGYVETLLGRRRYIEELQSKNMSIKKFGERAAINAPIQGSASDIVKKAMIRVHNELPLEMLLQVHDELIFEGAEKDLKHHLHSLIQIMEGVVMLKVPLKVNYSIGNNWNEAH